ICRRSTQLQEVRLRKCRWMREALSCPVCLDLFTPPILVLSCAHNFCKPCLEKILIHQNCNHVNGHFHCPLCRKVSRNYPTVCAFGGEQM
uniref:RING-type domain-containing protein n=1 Tax=Nothoprocta perdicaria TaxID=30464 RepID=A0A8C6Z2Y5_NOTPE